MNVNLFKATVEFVAGSNGLTLHHDLFYFNQFLNCLFFFKLNGGRHKMTNFLFILHFFAFST